jgi:Flp pilus assembly protein TadG
MKRISSSTQRQRGAIAVEFAILATLLFTLVIGILDVGNVMFLYNNMLNVAREASRSVAVGEATQAQGQTQALAKLNNFYGKSGKVNFTVVVTLPVAGQFEVKTTVSAPLSQMLMLDVFKLFGNSTLTAVASMRQET